MQYKFCIIKSKLIIHVEVQSTISNIVTDLITAASANIMARDECKDTWIMESKGKWSRNMLKKKGWWKRMKGKRSILNSFLTVAVYRMSCEAKCASWWVDWLQRVLGRMMQAQASLGDWRSLYRVRIYISLHVRQTPLHCGQQLTSSQVDLPCG